MNALDELMAEFNDAAGALPAVNPPEAAKVLETQTKPEVAGEPEPPDVETTTAPPTEKPADVKAAEAAKTRKPRASKATETAQAVVAAATSTLIGAPSVDLTAAIRIVAVLLPKGSSVTIPGEA